MRRLARRPFTLCTALSLLLFVTVCVLWGWSYAATPWIVQERSGRGTVVAAYRGRVLIETIERSDPSTWPGFVGGTRGVNPPSERLYLEARGLRPRPVLGFQ